MLNEGVFKLGSGNMPERSLRGKGGPGVLLCPPSFW